MFDVQIKTSSTFLKQAYHSGAWEGDGTQWPGVGKQKLVQAQEYSVVAGGRLIFEDIMSGDNSSGCPGSALRIPSSKLFYPSLPREMDKEISVVKSVSQHPPQNLYRM